MTSKARKQVIIWLMIIAVIVLIMAVLSHTYRSDALTREQMIAQCVKNLPFSPQWNDFAKIASNNEQAFTQNYCTCVINDMMSGLTEQQKASLPRQSQSELMQIFGGQEGIKQRSKRCLSKLSR